jgi:UDP-N-acetylmuramoyl-L-alanyl-D-glutamate--2,6-diaminopimelate ligase
MSLTKFLRHNSVVIYLRKHIPNGVVNRAKHFPMGFVANIAYRFPSRALTVVGVTGTDGKTTTSSMLYHILHNSGVKVALISTVSAMMGDEEIDTGFHVTSPDHISLQRLLKKIKDKGFTHVVLETTSHGLSQYRFWGVKFKGGIVTNITEDHLDYHKTWKDYALSKAKLFLTTEFAVLNREDKSYSFLKNKVNGKIIDYGLKKGDWNLKNFPVKLSIPGEFNKLMPWLQLLLLMNWESVKKKY